MIDELFEIVKPVIRSDYYAVAVYTGITLEDYMKLRRYEFEANELRFPGYAEFYAKKIKRVKKWGWFSKVAIVALIVKNLLA